MRGINFAVTAGETFGFLGPNGAGKSATIKILCTLANPSSGSARVAGYGVVKKFRSFHLFRRNEAPFGDRPRSAARAPGAFLDEPTVGLDPQTRSSIWEYVNDLKQREDITIFLTTHYMDEAEHCDRIAIIDHGKIVAIDTPENLKASVGKDRARISTADDQAAIGETAQLTTTTDVDPVTAAIRVSVPECGLRQDLRAVRIVWYRELSRFKSDRLCAVTSLVQPVLFLADGADPVRPADLHRVPDAARGLQPPFQKTDQRSKSSGNVKKR